jgi:multiple sugar transport system permease protein
MSTGNRFKRITERLDRSGLVSSERYSREALEGYLFALPYLLFFAIFLLYPLVKGFWMSLHDWNLLFPSESQFIGLENYSRMLNDPAFWQAFKNTVVFVAVTVPLLLIVSLLLALGVNREIKGRRLLRIAYFSPYILTVSVVGILWEYMYGSQGAIGNYLEPLIGTTPLSSATYALGAIILATVWWQTGFFFAILLAARQNVPQELYEAAKLDGARSWRMFRDITLPQMRNSLLFVSITGFIFQFQVFGQPYTMTKGGPVGSTATLVFYLYEVGFSRQQFGFAAAVGYIVLLILVVVSIANYKLIGVDDK